MATIFDRIRALYNGDITRGIYEAVSLLSNQVDINTNIPVRAVTTTTYTIVDADNGYTLLFTNAAGCTVSVSASLSRGVSMLLVQDAAGVITLAAAGGLTFLASAGIVAPYTSVDQGSTICITKVDATRALITGAAT